jgi:hypothetical protein
MDDRPAGSFVMVRTTCCETFKETGVRCSVCPHRAENMVAAREFERILRSPNRRRTYTQPLCGAPEPAIAGE